MRSRATHGRPTACTHQSLGRQAGRACPSLSQTQLRCRSDALPPQSAARACLQRIKGHWAKALLLRKQVLYALIHQTAKSGQVQVHCTACCPPNTRLAQHPPSARKAIRSRPNPALRCCHRPQCGKPRTPLRGSRLSSLGAAISLSGLSRGSWQMASASGGASRMKPSRSASGGQGAGTAGR